MAKDKKDCSQISRDDGALTWAEFEEFYEQDASLRQLSEKNVDRLNSHYSLTTHFAVVYAKKLIEGDGGVFCSFNARPLTDRDWGEANNQARLIDRRLDEIEGTKSLEAVRERLFLKVYARTLLLLYMDRYSMFGGPYMERGSQIAGIPMALIRILYREYPGRAAAVRMLRFEAKKVGNKAFAVLTVEICPDIPQSELARLARVNVGTIRNWAPDLKAAGWMGTVLERKAAAKSKEPVEPDSQKPGTPGLAELDFMKGKRPEDE